MPTDTHRNQQPMPARTEGSICLPGSVKSRKNINAPKKKNSIVLSFNLKHYIISAQVLHRNKKKLLCKNNSTVVK
jgi:hypothetical protein